MDADDIITAVVATAGYLRAAHAGCSGVPPVATAMRAKTSKGSTLVGPDEPADVVVLGGASDDFTYATINHVFRSLMDGAALVGMHRNMFWRTSDGLELDGGAYIAGLEEAAGVRSDDLRQAGAGLLRGGARAARRAGDRAPRWSATTS